MSRHAKADKLGHTKPISVSSEAYVVIEEIRRRQPYMISVVRKIFDKAHRQVIAVIYAIRNTRLHQEYRTAYRRRMRAHGLDRKQIPAIV